MKGAGIFTRAIIKREIRRARRTGTPINRTYLNRETGLPWHRLEKEISWAAQEIIDTENPPSGPRLPPAGGDADGNRKTAQPPPGKAANVRFASPTRSPTPKRHPAPDRGAAGPYLTSGATATPRTRNRF